MARAALVLAAVAGLALAGCGGNDDDDGGGGGGTSTKPNTTAISLPASLGDYKDIVVVTKSKNPNTTVLAGQQTRVANTTKLTTAAYSQAFGGAASAFRAYSDDALEQQPSVIAVRAEAPGITYGPVIKPQDLNLVKSQNEIQKVGEAECLVFWEPIVRGSKPKPSQQHPRMCQRVGDRRTVFVYGNGFEGAGGLEELAKLAEEAWSATG